VLELAGDPCPAGAVHVQIIAGMFCIPYVYC